MANKDRTREAAGRPHGRRGGRDRTGAERGRGRRALVNIALGMVVLVSVAAVSFLLLQVSGKNSLYSHADSGEMMSTLSGLAVELGGTLESLEGEDWQEGDFRFEGVHYRYNKDIMTFLFLGIDKMGEVAPVESGIDGGQSDAIFLLVLDPHAKEMTVIGVPRDTMAQIEMYGNTGGYLGPVKAQLALQHGYGDGGKVSCERSRDAVSELFYGLPIHGYCAINMGAIPLLNDAVGGIDVVALNSQDVNGFRMEEGQELHLEGMDAYHYLHDRDIHDRNTAGKRLQRQKQYLEAYAAAAMEELKADPTFAVSLYGTLSRYMVTDISLDEVGYLATQVPGYSFSGGRMHVLEGETRIGEKYEEFHVDEDALYRLVLDVFYEEVG